MKKNTGWGFILLISISLQLNACRKCTVCKVFDSQGNELPDPKRTCGNKTDLEKAEETAALRAMNLSGTYDCQSD